MLGDDTRQIDATDEAIVDYKPLRPVLSRSLNRKKLDLLNEFLKDSRCQLLHRHSLIFKKKQAVVQCLSAKNNRITYFIKLLSQFFRCVKFWK